MTAPGGSADVLVVRRLLPAPREYVFAAWLDPTSLARWMCPGRVEGATAEVEPRVGGKFRIGLLAFGGACGLLFELTQDAFSLRG